jgi:hypothetical protein
VACCGRRRRRAGDAVEALGRGDARRRPGLRLADGRRAGRSAAARRLDRGRVRRGAGAGAGPRVVGRLGRVRLRLAHLSPHLPERGDGRAAAPGRLDLCPARPLLAAAGALGGGAAGGSRRPAPARRLARRVRRPRPGPRRPGGAGRPLAGTGKLAGRRRHPPAGPLAAGVAGRGGGRRRLVGALLDPARRPVRDLAGRPAGAGLAPPRRRRPPRDGGTGAGCPARPLRRGGAGRRRRDEPGDLRSSATTRTRTRSPPTCGSTRRRTPRSSSPSTTPRSTTWPTAAPPIATCTTRSCRRSPAATASC